GLTLLDSPMTDGSTIPSIDGSTWDPFAGVLLFTAEGGPRGGVYMATPDWPSTITDMAAIFGRGGYEGIQNDSDGNVWIVEDVGGPAGHNPSGIAAFPSLTHAKQPNSFLYRFVPVSKGN